PPYTPLCRSAPGRGGPERAVATEGNVTRLDGPVPHGLPRKRVLRLECGGREAERGEDGDDGRETAGGWELHAGNNTRVRRTARLMSGPPDASRIQRATTRRRTATELPTLHLPLPHALPATGRRRRTGGRRRPPCPHGLDLPEST